MTFTVPTLAQLRARVRSEIESRLAVGPLLDDSILAVLGEAVAAQAHLLHGHLEHISRQVIPDTADSEFLVRWASLFGVVRIGATGAAGPVAFTGSDGVLIPAGTIVRREDGTEFSTDVDGTIAGGTVSIAVSASALGASSNTAAATALAFLSPIAGIDAGSVVDTGGIVGGLDTETDAALLARLVEALQLPPMGGSLADYSVWAKEIAEVTRVWAVGAQFGLGSVGVAFVTDDAATGPIPIAGKVSEVQDHLDVEKPVTALVTAFAPTALDLDPEIQLIGTDTPEIRTAIQTALDDLVRTIGGPSITIPLSKISEAISNANGEEDHLLISPVADVTTTATQVHQVGTITFS